MASERQTIEQVEGILAPLLRDEGLELVDVEFRPSGKRWLLRVFIDRDTGVTIADCERVSRELSRVLDVDDVIDHAYTLEVSSPGLTRALKSREDFFRYRGRLCRIVTREQVEGRNDFVGTIGDVGEEAVVIKGEMGVFTVPLYAIKKAHLELEL